MKILFLNISSPLLSKMDFQKLLLVWAPPWSSLTHKGNTRSFPSILFLSHSLQTLELLRTVLEKEEVLAWQHLQLLGAARPLYTHKKCSRWFRPHNRAALLVYRGVKLRGKFREGKSKQQMGGQPRHLYHQAMRRPEQEEFCSDSGVEYITGYTQGMFHASAPGHHSRVLSSLSRAALHSSLSCTATLCFPHRPRDAPAARHASSFQRPECPVQPWLGQTCPASNCSKGCEQLK